MNTTIGFVGMTHLGLVSAAAAAAKGYDVVCFDLDQALVAGLREGRLPVLEPGLDDLVRGNGGRQTFSSDAGDLARCGIVYIAPDVPTDDVGEADLTAIRALIAAVLPGLAPESIVVILSQVPPGFTAGIDFPRHRLFYQVETLIFGRAVERAMHPERFIVGCDNPGLPLPAPLAGFLGTFDCLVLPMAYKSAELAKIAINMCLVSSLSTANLMAEVCEHIGADWNQIIPALRLDRRIGEFSYIVPGLGLSGGNLERDVAAVARLAHTHGIDAGIIHAWNAKSEQRKGWPYRMLHGTVLQQNPNARIAVLGLAYKENTHSTKNSPALKLLAELQEVSATVYDPIVAADHAGANARGADSPMAAARGADAVLIMTPWPQFRDIDPRQLATAMAGDVVIDPYRILNPDSAQAAGLRVYSLGAGLA